MKQSRFARLRAGITGLTFAVAAMMGAILPALDVAAVAAVAPTSLRLYIDTPGTWRLSWIADTQVEPAISGWHLTIINQTTSAIVQDGALTSSPSDSEGNTHAYFDSPPAGEAYELRLAASQGSEISPNYADLSVTVAENGSLVGADEYGNIYGEDYVAPVTPNGFTGMPSGVIRSTTGPANSTQVVFSLGSGSLVRVAEATFDFSGGDISAAGFTFGTDVTGHKAFAHGVAQAAVGGSFALYVPFKEGDTAVAICPGASSLNSISSTCPGYYYLAENQSKNGATASIVTDFDDKYWKVDGLTGTGGYSTTLASAEAAVVSAPDTGFSLGLVNPALVIGIGAVSAALLFLIGRKLARR